MAFFSVHKKAHWCDGDAAGIAWFASYFGWFENAEEELFAAALDRSRHSFLESEDFGMPRVEAQINYEAPVKIATCLRIGVEPQLENFRHLRHLFEMWDDAACRRVASGFVRVGCVRTSDFTPRDFPHDVRVFVERIQELAAAQARGETALPWA
ncbi:MAG TPA: hypothetical protein VMW48_08220 [Vicinamibacterales bacterium]|nr:hypothetical protein [Vicinamibacterales bacterium]